MHCLNKDVVSLKICLDLLCPEMKDDEAFLLEKTQKLDENLARKLEQMTQENENILLDSVLNEEKMNQMLPTGDKSLLELLILQDQNRKLLRHSSKMASAQPEEDALNSVLTSLVKRKPLLTSVGKRRWSQEVAECIKLECSHMGSLADIVPCQENCRAKW